MYVRPLTSRTALEAALRERNSSGPVGRGRGLTLPAWLTQGQGLPGGLQQLDAAAPEGNRSGERCVCLTLPSLLAPRTIHVKSGCGEVRYRPSLSLGELSSVDIHRLHVPFDSYRRPSPPRQAAERNQGVGGEGRRDESGGGGGRGRGDAARGREPLPTLYSIHRGEVVKASSSTDDFIRFKAWDEKKRAGKDTWC